MKSIGINVAKCLFIVLIGEALGTLACAEVPRTEAALPKFYGSEVAIPSNLYSLDAWLPLLEDEDVIVRICRYQDKMELIRFYVLRLSNPYTIRRQIVNIGDIFTYNELEAATGFLDASFAKQIELMLAEKADLFDARQCLMRATKQFVQNGGSITLFELRSKHRAAFAMFALAPGETYNEQNQRFNEFGSLLEEPFSR